MKQLVVEKILHHPYFNVVGHIVGILGFSFAIYAFLASQKLPHLSIYELPRKAIVVSTKEASDIKVLFNNTPIKGDVVATQLVIWNSGNDSIRKDMILDDIQIYTTSPIKIYDVRVIKSTRSIIQFSFQKLPLKNVISASWKILEPHDGAILQIIHSATKSNDKIFEIKGTIERQGGVSVHKNLVELNTIRRLLFVSTENRDPEKDNTVVGWITIAMGFLGLASYFYRKIKSNSKWTLSSGAFMVTSMLYLIVGVLMVLSSPPTLPL